MMQVLKKFISKILKEEIGRNYHTVNTDPITFESFQDYDIQINPVMNDRYSLEILYKGRKIIDQVIFRDFEEANNQARKVIDNHRVKVMNSIQ